jgi:hypothetical protein
MMVESSCSIRKAMATTSGIMMGSRPEGGFSIPGAGTSWDVGGDKTLSFLDQQVRFRMLSGKLAR